MTGIFAILDDIAMLMDDVAVMTKIAAKKTAGVLGDDLAVGAEKASKFRASRELPVLWKITKGSLLNKLIILPFAFLLTPYPNIVMSILLFGGAYLALEGVEKIIHTIKHFKDKPETETLSMVDKIENQTDEEMLETENKKVKSAVITDFILSIEIIMIALGTVLDKPLESQIFVVSFIALLATIGVYGIVALMVRMDDVGYHFINKCENKNSIFHSGLRNFGYFLVWALPKLIKLLAVIGTIAMLLVGGGLFVHQIHQIHDFFHFLPTIATELLVGLIVGTIVYIIVETFLYIKSELIKTKGE